MEKNVQFEDFCETMRGLVQEKKPECKVTIQKILKNNDTEKVGLHILTDETEPVVPCIYLLPYYEDFISSDVTMEGLADELLTTYENSKKMSDRDLKDNLDWISDFGQCKEKLYYRLLNTQMNEELLKNIPHMAFMDLSIVFYLFLKDADGAVSSIQVNNLLLDMWKVTVSDLMQYAKVNTPKLFPLKVCSMTSMLNELMQDDNSVLNTSFPTSTDDLLIVTNESTVNGAAALLYSNLMDGVLEQCPELEHANRLVILPSSVHECLIVGSAMEKMDLEGFQNMVRTVNADGSIMLREDVLSNSVYYYYPDTKTFCIAEE